MLCTYCGATSAPTLDRCVVCHTPFPPGVLEPAETSLGTGPDLDQTRLGDETRIAEDPDATRIGPPLPPEPSSPSIRHVGGVPVLDVGHTFAGRYTIIRLLGAGGMAAVYQAWDETLRTAVALKLIRFDPSMQPSDILQLEERFKRELKLARQVTHPNVVRIHDLGEVGRTLYLTMAYVQGSDLATILQKSGRLELARVLSLAKQAVSGLAAAHRAGIVHRDLKPANIMVDADDQALLTDFGIARSTTGEQTLRPDVGISLPSTGSTLHTMPGAIMGTLEYMAPEQARGEPADARTDVYAFGLILYELLAGGRPRAKGGDLAQLLARIQQGPPPLKTVLPDVPDPVERIVAKCLQPDPAARYATADELYADLAKLDDKGKVIPTLKRIPRWKVLTSAAVISAVLVTATWQITRLWTVPEAPRPPLPVLIVDFENRAQDAAFDGALEQALGISMEGAPFITAFPRRDAAGLVRSLKLGDKLDETTGRLVANREGIPVVLAGSIDREGGGYRIAVRAIDPSKPEPPLAIANQRASDKGAVLGAVGKVAERLREALGDTTPATQAETFTAASLDAIREYTIAQDLSADQRDEEAVTHYEKALEHDKEFGRAYAGLAMSLHYLGRRQEDAAKPWQEALKRTDRMTERERLRTSGLYYAAVPKNFELAIDTYTQLVDKYPADSAGHNNLAVGYFGALNFAKALEHGKIAIDIYPKSVKYRSNYALYAMYAGDFKTAETTAQGLLKENPAFETAYLPLAMSALAAGDPARAVTAYEQAAKGGGAGASLAALGLADIAIYQGRFDDAIAQLPAAIKLDIEQKNSFGAISKLLALAEAYAARAQITAMQAVLTQVEKLGEDDSVLVTAARLSVATGKIEQAKAIAARLGQKLPAQSRAYGKVVEAEIAMATKQYPAALDLLNSARKLADLWLVRYDTGLAYFQSGAYLEADAEFAKCEERRGEATAVFLDDLPTFRYYATVPYWLGRAREMRGLDAKAQYQQFVTIRSGAPTDPLVADAKRRLAAGGKRP